ncbi:MAG TPA: serine--tRNA ligase, partial [Ferruginibacter sp.]|nr:serine--tRNA ligase [Ferruginibacter sp.]
MLQIGYIRQNTALVKERLAVKHFGDLSVVDKLVELDEQVRKLKTETESIQSSVNAASKEIGMLMGKGEKEAAEAKKLEVAGNKTNLQSLATQLAEAEKSLYDNLVLLPNLPHSSVPKGKTPEDNVVAREGGNKPSLPASAVPHWELIKKYDLVDFETGAKITGSGFPLYKGKGAKLQRA